MYVKVTVDFMVANMSTADEAKNTIDTMLRTSNLPHYNIRPVTTFVAKQVAGE